MVYCTKCGNKNEEGAEFCSKCGASLSGVKKEEDRCEEACVVGKHSPYASVFWGIVVILVGLWIIFGLVLPETSLRDSLPSWFIDMNWWWIIGLIIALAIIGTGIRMLIKK